MNDDLIANVLAMRVGANIYLENEQTLWHLEKYQCHSIQSEAYNNNNNGDDVMVIKKQHPMSLVGQL